MDREPDDERTTPDDVLIVALAEGLSVPKAAAKANMGERTARTRLADPAFRKRVDVLRGELVDEAIAILGKSMSGAALELAKLVTESKDERVRLEAAKQIIAARLKARQMEDLQRQVEDLTRRLEALAAKRKGK
jgi:hypothetical protein